MGLATGLGVRISLEPGLWFAGCVLLVHLDCEYCKWLCTQYTSVDRKSKSVHSLGTIVHMT